MPDREIEAQSDVHPENSTEVYAIYGAEPEVLAYAMAKYSRSALTMRESLAEISSQRAEQFLNTFYFQYGHRSIADLAHIPFAVERPTRYQDFRRSGWYTPKLAPELKSVYAQAVQALFTAYDALSLGMFEVLKDSVPKPEEMKPEQYARTLKA